MQTIKDTFYEFLRARLAALYPERTVVLRGLTRPAVLVEENELPALSVDATSLPDCFRLRWTGIRPASDTSPGTVGLTCEIAYATAGTQPNAGMDRGRAIAAMDEALRACVNPLPRNAPRQDFSALAHGGVATADGSRIWWSSLDMGKTEQQPGRLARTATLIVMGLEKEGLL